MLKTSQRRALQDKSFDETAYGHIYTHYICNLTGDESGFFSLWLVLLNSCIDILLSQAFTHTRTCTSCETSPVYIYIYRLYTPDVTMLGYHINGIFILSMFSKY